MPRIIFKCPYIKPEKKNASVQRKNYVRYIATREGVERADPGKSVLPATSKQQMLVRQLLRDFPSCRELFEYSDYLASPTRGNASEFITRTMEDYWAPAEAQRSGFGGERSHSGMSELLPQGGSEGYGACGDKDQIVGRGNYVNYIAKRPRAERSGSHGLFSDGEDSVDLSQVAETVATHPGNVWLPIISLRREDAARLGYDNARQWRELLTGLAPQIAEAMKIPNSQFRWYAAFHNEGHHPHVHMVCYSTDGRSGFLNKNGIASIKSTLAKEIFRQDLTELYRQQTQRRDELTQESQDVMRQLIEQMKNGTLDDPNIERLMLDLAERLNHTKGKKQYGYLQAPLKSIIDTVVDELEKDPRIAAAYEQWYLLKEDTLRTYKDKLPARLPLSRQETFKRIRNIVVEEAVQLGKDYAVLSPENTPDPHEPMSDIPSPADEPLEPLLTEKEEQSPPIVNWSKRYEEVRRLLYGSQDVPPDFEEAYRLLMDEAVDGNALAMYDLGRLFADGIGRDADEAQAQAWYTKALAAFQAVERERPDRYVEYRLGKMFAAGTGTEKDYTAAAKWFVLSADQGYPYAQCSLAKLYSEGQGVEQSYETAFNLYEQAAAKGIPYAAWELGKLCRDGVGCRPDEQRSARYFAAAFRGFKVLEAQSHDDRLQYRLGWMLLHGVGVDQDKAAARNWFERAAELGNKNAKYQLAKLILTDAAATAEEIAQAVEYLTKAAEEGSEHAQYALGKLFRDGGPVERDRIQAVIWFSQAAEQGNEYAMYDLGKLNLEVGNAETALRWFRKAAELGNQYAQYQAGKLLLSGEGIPKNVEEAVRWFNASADQGNHYAQYILGKLHLLGQDIPRDKDAAVRWFTQAAEQGNEHAQYFLNHMNDPQGPPLLTSATKLLYHMSRIFRDELPPAQPGIHFVESKLRRRIMEKRMALHRPDDHEDPPIAMR